MEISSNDSRTNEASISTIVENSSTPTPANSKLTSKYGEIIEIGQSNSKHEDSCDKNTDNSKITVLEVSNDSKTMVDLTIEDESDKIFYLNTISKDESMPITVFPQNSCINPAETLKSNALPSKGNVQLVSDTNLDMQSTINEIVQPKSDGLFTLQTAELTSSSEISKIRTLSSKTFSPFASSFDQSESPCRKLVIKSTNNNNTDALQSNLYQHAENIVEEHGDTWKNVALTVPEAFHPACHPKIQIFEGDFGFKNVIGCTPLIHIQNSSVFKRYKCNFYMKLGYMVPTGSIKDYVAAAIIDDGIRNHKIDLGNRLKSPDLTLIVPGSGSLAVSLALIGCQRGFKVIAILANGEESSQKAQVLQKLGGNVIFTHEQTVHWESHNLSRSLPNSIIIDEYSKPELVVKSYIELANEILRDLHGEVDMIICTSESAGLARSIQLTAKNCIIIGAQLRKPKEKPDTRPSPPVKTRELKYFYSIIAKANIPGIRYSEAIKMIRHIEKAEGITLSPRSGAVLATSLIACSIFKLEHQKVNIVLLMDENIQILNSDTSFLSDLCKLEVQKPIQQKWWYSLNMSHIELDPPELISSSFPVSFAICRMTEDHTDRMIVMNESHQPIGVILLLELQVKVQNGKLEPTTPLESNGVYNTNFLTVPVSTTFGQVIQLIESRSYRYIILTQRQLCCLPTPNTDEGLKCQDIVVGSLAASKVQHYSTQFEENCQFNTPLVSASGVPVGEHVWKLE